MVLGIYGFGRRNLLLLIAAALGTPVTGHLTSRRQQVQLKWELLMSEDGIQQIILQTGGFFATSGTLDDGILHITGLDLKRAHFVLSGAARQETAKSLTARSEEEVANVETSWSLSPIQS